MDVRGNLQESVFYFHPVGPVKKIQVLQVWQQASLIAEPSNGPYKVTWYAIIDFFDIQTDTVCI